MSFTLPRSSLLIRTSFSPLHRTSIRSLRLTPCITTPCRTFVSSSIRNMAPPAPTGLFSNRYKLEDIPDLSGKTAIVTGGTRGIGEGLVAALAKKGAEVHILGATEQHAKEAIDHVISDHPAAKGKLHYHTVDLGSLASLRDLVQSTLSSLPRIDLLFLIAGIGVAPFGLTKDGLPNHYAVNVLSQFLLVDGLLPKMIETSKSKANGSELEKFSTRIVSESSELHRAAPSDVKCENLEELSQDIDETKLYGRSKLLDIYFIRELAKKHLPSLNSGNPIMALAVHPGAVATEQQQGATEAYGILGKLLEYAASIGFMSKEQGAESASWAGTGETVVSRREEVQGRYFTEADGKVDTESNQAKDDQVAENLWNLSVKTLKEKIGYEVKM